MDFIQILGNQENSEELLGILFVIERTYFATLSPMWISRGEKREDRSPGPVGPGADWIYYDPIAYRAIGKVDARHLVARVRPPIPDWHPVDFNFEMTPAGWVD